MFDSPQVESLDMVACADALAAGVEAQRRAGAERLAHSAHFADLHGPGSIAGHRHVRMVPGGSDGTPEVSEFAADELGMLVEQSTRSATALLRDALDLRHRHPRLWDEVMTGAVDDWKARKVAQACAVLTREQALWVDQVTVEAVVGLPFGRALAVVEGKVIAADPAGHDARRAAAEGERFVRATRSDGSGLRMLYARTTSGDVARLDAMIGHLARLLQSAGDTDDLQRRRAKALGLLANPALACVHLADHRPEVTTDMGPEPSHAEPTEPTEPTDAVAAAWVLGETLRASGTAALDRLRPRTVLYLHLAEEAVVGGHGRPQTQVVRTEGLGAVTRDQLAEWLGRDQLVVTPVIDLHGQEPADAYEVPQHLREAMVLAHPYEVFPFGTTSARAPSVDADHTRPWVPPDEGGPPGQTRLDNLGPLARGHHRAKTLGGFSSHQPLPGLYLWRTPTGHWYRVDHTGTTALGRDLPDVLRHLQDPAWPGSVSRATVDWTVGERRLGGLLQHPAA